MALYDIVLVSKDFCLTASGTVRPPSAEVDFGRRQDRFKHVVGPFIHWSTYARPDCMVETPRTEKGCRPDTKRWSCPYNKSHGDEVINTQNPGMKDVLS